MRVTTQGAEIGEAEGDGFAQVPLGGGGVPEEGLDRGEVVERDERIGLLLGLGVEVRGGVREAVRLDRGDPGAFEIARGHAGRVGLGVRHASEQQ